MPLSSVWLSLIWRMENTEMKAQDEVEKRHKRVLHPAKLCIYKSWTNAKNLPDAALNPVRSLWSQNAVEDSRQKGKWLLCTWQNQCWAGAKECYSALTAETATQLHCALQSVLLRHKEQPCKGSIYAHELQKLLFLAPACHGAWVTDLEAEPGLARGHCEASPSVVELICNLDIQPTDSWEFTSPLSGSLHFSTLPLIRWIWLFSGIWPVKSSQWNILSTK